MLLSRLVTLEAGIRAASSTHEKEHLIRYALMEADMDGRAPEVALMLCGSLTRPGDGRTMGIKEAFIAQDLAVDGVRSLEGIIAAVRGRACGWRPVSVLRVWERLQRYLAGGERNHAVKGELLTSLFYHASSDEEVGFLLRLVVGKMGNGVQEARVLHAMLRDATPARRDDANRAYALEPDLWAWVLKWSIYDHDLPDEALGDAEPVPFVPLVPQLCAREKDLQKVLDAHGGETLVQPKIDGVRIHIHRVGDKVRLWSRSLKDCTEDYPEVVEQALALPIERFILDGELVAVAEDGDILPFQALQTRLGRKAGREAVRLGVVLYDALHGPTGTPYEDRLGSLFDVAPSGGFWRVVPGWLVDDADRLRAMLLECHEAGQEGLVCKDPRSLMHPGGRSRDWIKLKPDYMESTEFGDTYDLVVIGFNWGKGKRHGKVGALWLGVDCESGIVPVCKVGTGFSEEELDWFTENLRPMAGPKGIGGMGSSPKVDAWVEPRHVVEVRASEVTRIDHWAGFSLRFPRYIRRRDDKSVMQATTVQEILGEETVAS